MDRLLTNTLRVAFKAYDCMASEYVMECDWDKFTDAELAAIESARRDKWKIKKGIQYVYQIWMYEGGIATFRARIDMHDICLRHDLYAVGSTGAR